MQPGALVLPRHQLQSGAGIGVDQRIGTERFDQLDPRRDQRPGGGRGCPHPEALGADADEPVGRQSRNAARGGQGGRGKGGQRGRGQHIHLRRADELRHEAIGRPVIQFERGADLLDRAVAQHHHAIGQRHRLDLIVSDVDRGCAELAVQLGDLDPGLAAQRGVEIGQWLVEQEHLGRAHNRPPDRNPLALAARQLCRPALQVGPEVEDCRGALDLVANHRLVDVRQPQRKRHVIGYRHVRIQRIRLEHHRQVALGRRQIGDVAPVEHQAAAIDRFQAGDQPQ